MSEPTFGSYLHDLHKHAHSKVQYERVSTKFSSNNQFGTIENFPNTAFVH